MRICVGLTAYKQLGEDRTGHFQVIRNSVGKMQMLAI